MPWKRQKAHMLWERHVGFGKDIFYNCSPCGFGKSFGMLLWKRQTQVACHALEKAKGTYALGKASGFWKMALEKVDLTVGV